MFEPVLDNDTDFAKMFSVRGMNKIAARRWWSEQGLRESCDAASLAISSCYKRFLTL